MVRRECHYIPLKGQPGRCQLYNLHLNSYQINHDSIQGVYLLFLVENQLCATMVYWEYCTLL